MYVQFPDNLLSLSATKRFGYSQEFGSAHFGYTLYGMFKRWVGIYRRKRQIIRQYIGFGCVNFGITRYGTNNPKNAVYSTTDLKGEARIDRMQFYWPSNPRTVPQQANRTKFAIALLAWQSLTLSEKEVYNNLARGRRMSGMNLYMAQAMRSS